MMTLPIPEEHDKPLKYPLVFEVCYVITVNESMSSPYITVNGLL